MRRTFGSRALLVICGLLVALLAALAAVQYRWSMRVAAADAQREKEHLVSAASLFASAFNGLAGQALEFQQNEAWDALHSGKRLASVPKLIGELYYLDISVRGSRKAQKLSAAGAFQPVPLPEWLRTPRCAPLLIERPLALVTPILPVRIHAAQRYGGKAVRVLRTFNSAPERCFVARIDEKYLRDTLFPQLVRQSFGETASAEYDFAVVWRRRPLDTLFGSPMHTDLKWTFFSIAPIRMAFSTGAPGPDAVFVEHVQTAFAGKSNGRITELFGSGVWELDVAHKGVSLAESFERTRQRNLLLSLGVEVLLVAAIVFLVIGARRIQRLADQKVQFVAGVSHELRTPVSAIAMLSRNQADGLIGGSEKVKQYGELIHQQSRRLNEMVEQTLQYAGIQSGQRRPAKSEVDLRRVIQEAVAARREDLTRQGFEVEVALGPDLPAVAGDAPLLRTAIDNLLSNAQKYADGGHWIRVSAVYSEPEKEVRISVEDRGVGIDPAEQTEIFEPFCRGQAAVEAQVPGSGLGLSLVRTAAEAHRGSVTLVSEPGRGTTFTMHLPV